ncbi:MAG: signal recognition particle protein, partial [Planctomycetales bacterium 4484_113]
VADAMTGQEAVNIAQTFEQRLGITGVILTKFDGDARGGAALSIRETVGRSIRLVGVGEKLDALEPFYPERWAQRILGMGDMLTLIEKAEAAFTVEEAREMERRVRKRKFTLSEFLDILQKAKKLGSLGQVARLIPGVQLNEEQLAAGQKELRRVEAIVRSMTPLERKDPRVLNASRRRRIAAGSGTTVQDINRFIKQFAQMQQAMEQLKRGKLPLGNLLKRGRF